MRDPIAGLLRTLLAAAMLAGTAYGAPPAAKTSLNAQRRDLERRSKLAFHRIRKELARGAAVEDLKLPEAAPELDHFIAELKERRATHEPLKAPNEAMQAVLRNPENRIVGFQMRRLPSTDEGTPVPAELVERFGNRDHPKFVRELAYLDKVTERAEELKRDGIPYKRYLEFVNGHLGGALDMKIQVFREQPKVLHDSFWTTPTVALNSRPDVDVLMKDGKLVDEVDHHQGELHGQIKPFAVERMKQGLFFPASIKLGYGSFNRVSGYPIYFVGLPTAAKDRTSDGDGESGGYASGFTAHDIGHSMDRLRFGEAPAGTTRKDSMRIARRFQRLVERERDPKARERVQELWFGTIHEAGQEVSLEQLEHIAARVRSDDPGDKLFRTFVASERARVSTKETTP